MIIDNNININIGNKILRQRRNVNIIMKADIISIGVNEIMIE